MAGSGSGNPCEAAVLSEFVLDGYEVLLPFGEGHPYDLVVAVGMDFLRVQCKTSRAVGGCLVFNAYATDHGRGPGSYVGRADIFGTYFPPTRSVYLVPVGLIESECRLRLRPTRNKQHRRVRFASDFEFSTWTAERLSDLARSEVTGRPTERARPARLPAHPARTSR